METVAKPNASKADHKLLEKMPAIALKFEGFFSKSDNFYSAEYTLCFSDRSYRAWEYIDLCSLCLKVSKLVTEKYEKMKLHTVILFRFYIILSKARIRKDQC